MPWSTGSSCSMPLKLWRIVTGPHPIWSGEGARRVGGRWNPAGAPVIYAGTSFALCLVEILVHANRKTPPSAARFIEALVPDDVSRETFQPAKHPGWDDLDNLQISQAFGRTWLAERRSSILLVPSVVTNGRDTSAVINPAHPDAEKIVVEAEARVSLDVRLFGP